MQCTVHSHTHCYFFCRSNVTFIGHATQTCCLVFLGYFNPLVFWYQWKYQYLLTSKEFVIFCRASKIGNVIVFPFNSWQACTGGRRVNMYIITQVPDFDGWPCEFSWIFMLVGGRKKTLSSLSLDWFSWEQFLHFQWTAACFDMWFWRGCVWT